MASAARQRKRGNQPKYVTDHEGNPIVGLHFHKASGRFYRRDDGNRRYLKQRDKDLAIIEFREWQEQQDGETVTVSTKIDPPENFDPDEFLEAIRKNDYVIDGANGSHAVKRHDPAAFWSSVRAEYKKNPKKFRELLGQEPSIRLSTLLETYLSDKHPDKPDGITKKEWANTRTWWNEFLKVTGATHCCDLTTTAFKKYREKVKANQAKNKRSNAYTRSRFGRIKTVILYATSGEIEDLTDDDRARLAGYKLLKSPGKPKATPIDIDPADFKKLNDQAEKPFDQATLLLCLNAAYTPVDLQRLEWDMIDFRKGIIRFDREKAIGRAKRYVPRICAMWDRTKDVLKAIRKDRSQRKITHPNVFLSHYGQPPHVDTFYDAFVTLCDKAGIDRKSRGKNGKALSLMHLRKSALTAAANSTDPVVPDMQRHILSGHEIGIDEHYVVKKNVVLACQAIENAYFGHDAD